MITSADLSPGDVVEYTCEDLPGVQMIVAQPTFEGYLEVRYRDCGCERCQAGDTFEVPRASVRPVLNG